MALPRKSVEEIIARYELAPTLADVYVEGDSDANIVEWYLQECGKKNAVVYEIGLIEIPADNLVKAGLENNNRGRVIYLAKLLSEVKRANIKAVCIADKDADTFLRKSYSFKQLLFTDYSCMEMYLFNPHTLNKFFKLVLRLKNIDTNHILDEMRKVLEDLFLIRTTNLVAGMCLKWICFFDCCDFATAKITFDLKEYVRRYLNAGGSLHAYEDFLSKINSDRAHFFLDARHQICGDDFIALLARFIHKCGSKHMRFFAFPDVVKRSLIGCLEIEKLKTERLFSELSRVC